MVIEKVTYTTSHGETFKTREEAEIAEATYEQRKQIEDFCKVYFPDNNGRANPAAKVGARAIAAWEASKIR